MERTGRNILYYLKWSYVGFYSLRNIACLILCAYYIMLSKAHQQAHERRRLVFTWLTRLGSNFRLMAAGGVFAHAYPLYLSLAQLAIHFWLLGEHLHMESNGFHVFMTNQKRSREMIEQSLEQYIKETANSSLNYSRNLARLQAKEATRRMNLITRAFRRPAPATRQPSFGGPQWGRQSALLRRQHQHLLELLGSSKEALWPWATRNQEWRQTLHRLGLNCHQAYTIFIWLSWTSAMLAAQRAAHLRLVAAREPTTWLDHLARTEQLLFAFAIIDWFSYELALIVANVTDQLAFLRQLNLEFQHLLAQMVSQPDCARDLDEQALELYLRYRFFVGQLEPCLTLVGFYISHYMGIVLPLTITVASVTWAMDSSEAIMSFYATFMVMCSVHFIISVGAFLNAKCMRLTKHIWSLQALGVGARDDNHQRLVSPHTLLLWNRINCDQQQVMNRFSCKMFNTIRVDYTTIIRLDFWIVSLVILVLTAR